MAFDLRPHLVDASADGQLYTSEDITPDKYENCTMACLRDTARDLGYGAPYDSEQLREMGLPGSHGGLGWGVSVTAAQQAFPALAAVMSEETPADLVAALESYGEQGFIVHAAFWCDSQAWVPPVGETVASHACRVLASDGAGFWFQNPWPHPDFYLTNDQVRGLWDEDGILVFKHSLGGDFMAQLDDKHAALLNEMLEEWGNVRTILGDEFYAGQFTQPADPKQAQSGVYVAIVTKLNDIQAKLAALPAQGPAGPVGPPGPAGPAGATPDVTAAVNASWVDVLKALLAHFTGK